MANPPPPPSSPVRTLSRHSKRRRVARRNHRQPLVDRLLSHQRAAAFIIVIVVAALPSAASPLLARGSVGSFGIRAVVSAAASVGRVPPPSSPPAFVSAGRRRGIFGSSSPGATASSLPPGGGASSEGGKPTITFESGFFASTTTPRPSPPRTAAATMTPGTTGMGMTKGTSATPSALRAATGSFFSSFLSESSQFLSNLNKCAADPKKGGEKVRVVLGNEAGDADSIISSLALAYVRGGGLLGSGWVGDDDDDSAAMPPTVPTVPVISVPRSDLPLRRETVLLLEMCGINPDGLAFIDDPFVKSLFADSGSGRDSIGGGSGGSGTGGKAEVELILTDHNRLRSSLFHLSDMVVEIVDHHEDEGAHPQVTGPHRDVAFDAETKSASVGSACTLVAERLFRALDAGKNGRTDEKSEAPAIEPSLALALLGAILLDTVDMSPEAGKGTPRDGKAIDSLLERTNWTKLNLKGGDDKNLFDDDGRPIRAKLHDHLRDSKFDRSFWDGMSAYDCLRIDYKRFEPNKSSSSSSTSDGNDGDVSEYRPPPSFGMSSVLLDMDSFLSKTDLVPSLKKFMGVDEANVPLLAVLTMTLVDDTPHREMLLAGKPDLIESVWEYLLNDEEAEFLKVTECEEVEAGDGDVQLLVSVREGLGDGTAVRRFRQGNPKGSRKQVAPVLLKKVSTLSE